MSFHFTSHLNLCEIFSEDERYSRTDHSIIFKVNKYIGTIFHPLNDHGLASLEIMHNVCGKVNKNMENI